MKIIGEYKQTEVGPIPGDWDVRRLDQISPSQSVGLVINPSSYFSERGTIAMLLGSNIEPNRINHEAARRISDASNKLIPASRLSAGDLVTVRVGEPGVTAVVPAHLDGCNCASMMIVRKGERFDSRWLCYLMNSPMGLRQVRDVQYGTAQKQFNISDAVGFLFPYPRRAEQEAIAEALSDADALIESLEQLLAKKRQIKQGAMQELLTGKRRLPWFGGEWNVRRFGEVVAPRGTRIDPRAAGPLEFCVELEHIGSATGELLSSTTATENSSLKSVFNSGDVLFGKLRAYLRKYWFADRSGVCSTEIWVLAPKCEELSAAYLFQLVQTDSFVEAASSSYGTHMPRSDWNVVKNYELSLPPTTMEQSAIATVLSDLDTEIGAIEDGLSKARQIKQGMMQELLTGRIRLV